MDEARALMAIRAWHGATKREAALRKERDAAYQRARQLDTDANNAANAATAAFAELREIVYGNGEHL
jgi:predicted  nucleic acid-binding Zn-ribbon protein